MSLKVISYNFDNNRDGERLVHSCAAYGYNMSWVGQGQGFKNFRQAKLDLLLEELMKVEEDYVMFTDGLDSWFLRDDAMKVFKTFKSPVVVSGNRDHYPVTDIYKVEEFPEAPTSFRFICSSQFMGETQQVINTIRIIQGTYGGFTDQEGWNMCVVRGTIPAVIDYKCKLFLNMTGVKPEELDDNFKLKETKIVPVSIHFGGPKGGDPNALNMVKFYEKWRTQHE